ncbi:hypothetical protein GCM10027169_16460 [Gordonia jinhuaensis]|uniref:Uncharacterized protein n=1 Tax=Gordonia jinhuaensis TaxID=1517702 RepID=A0A916X0G8_9ACTN|nr:hypothetical protein [Gordonia jinhuaensis]GGB48375.1 hypothetical protein GCM10011489_39390 [Gordonia jinhuaensis]
MTHILLTADLPKGLPSGAPGTDRSLVADQSWNLLAGDIPLPAATLSRTALSHNMALRT